jgi:hypothetical protein
MIPHRLKAVIFITAGQRPAEITPKGRRAESPIINSVGQRPTNRATPYENGIFYSYLSERIIFLLIY